jgi:hypothetical protein
MIKRKVGLYGEFKKTFWQMGNLIDIFLTMKSIIPNSNVRKVFDQLGKNKDGVPYHLHLLGLHFDGEEENVLNKYKDIAVSLKDSPNVIKDLIRDPNWRPALVGNAVVMLLKATDLQKDLIWRLENGSWVSPQLAVGIALIDEGFAEKEMYRIIKNAVEKSNPKTIMSAYSCLKFLKSKYATEFENTDVFEIWKEKDSWDNSSKIAEQHWDFWKNIEPIK